MDSPVEDNSEVSGPDSTSGSGSQSDFHASVDDFLLNSNLTGRWQVIMLTLACTTLLPAGTIMISPTFYRLNLSYSCLDSDHRPDFNQTNSTQDVCSLADGTGVCDSWHFNYSHTGISTSIQQSYQLVCDQEFLLKVHESFYFLGFLIGSIVCGYLSDRIGRIKCLSLSYFIMALFGTTMAFTTSFIVHLASWALVSAGNLSAWICAFTYTSEIVSVKNRHLPGLAIGVVFGIGVMLCAPLNLLLPNWRHMVASLAGMTFVCFLVCLKINESPKWLMTMKRYEEANEVFQHAVKLSGKVIPSEKEKLLVEKLPEGFHKESFFRTIKSDFRRVFNLEVVQSEVKGEGTSEQCEKDDTFFDLFRYPTLTKRLVLLSIHWVCANTLYYGLFYGASLFQQQLHVYSVLQGAASTVGPIIAMLFLSYFGRKTFVMGILFLAGLIFACNIFTQQLSTALVLLLTFSGNVLMINLFWLCYLWTTEIMPTVVRTSATGFGSMVARVTGLALPYVAILADIWSKLPFVFYASFAFIVILCTVCLPETQHKQLPNSLEEGNAFGVKQKKKVVVPV